MSEQYLHGQHSKVLASHAWRTAENSAGYLLDYLDEEMDILDVGCGVGTISVDLATHVPRGRVLGIDLAPEPLEHAADYAVARGVENVEFEQGNAYELPHRDGSFDIVHAHQLLQYLKDPLAAITEMKRVLRRGGLLALRESDYGAMAWYPEVGLSAWRELYEQLSRFHGGHPHAGRRLLEWVRATGFRAVEPTTSTWTFADPIEREYWADLWLDRIHHTSLSRIALEEGFTDAAGLQGIIDAWQDWARDDAGWFVVVHSEILARR